MRINNNTAALQTYTSMLRTDRAITKSMRRISSGVRINSVADDAAGMAISHKLRTQIRGLEMANRNSMDGISLLQTAEGALQEVDDMLKRIREIAIQTSNATMETDDRRKANEEVQQLLAEINDTAYKTEFNTIKLLNGGASRLTKTLDSTGVPVAPGAITTMFVSNEMDVGPLDYTITSVGTPASVLSGAATFPAAGGVLTINGESIAIEAGATPQQAVSQLQELLDRTGLEAMVTNGDSWDDYIAGTATLMIYTKDEGKAMQLTIGGSYAAGFGLTAGAHTGTDAVIAPGSTYNGATVSAVITGNKIEFVGAKNQKIDIKIELDKPRADGAAWLLKNGANTATLNGQTYKTNVLDFGVLKLQIGPNKNQEMAVQIPDLSIEGLGIENLHVKTFADSQRAIGLCDDAMARIAEVRASLGAYQNRLEHTVTSLSITSEATSTSLSRIYDTDVAWEMTQLTQNSVLSQAAMAILAQANQRPQQVLQLM